MKKEVKPTESELAILKILWQKQTASVREVHESLSENKDAGYTTTLKLMQIMYEKGYVVRDDSHKVHLYKPKLNQEQTQQQFLGKMIDTLFAGNSTSLVLQALGSNEHTAEELDKIQELINKLKQQ